MMPYRSTWSNYHCDHSFATSGKCVLSQTDSEVRADVEALKKSLFASVISVICRSTSTVPFMDLLVRPASEPPTPWHTHEEGDRRRTAYGNSKSMSVSQHLTADLWQFKTAAAKSSRKPSQRAGKPFFFEEACSWVQVSTGWQSEDIRRELSIRKGQPNETVTALLRTSLWCLQVKKPTTESTTA